MVKDMYCYQCQQTAGGKGCTRKGVCGKSPDTALMQDLLLYITKGISCVTTRMREECVPVNSEINHLVTQNLCATASNTNFDKSSFRTKIMKTVNEKKRLLGYIKPSNDLPEAVFWGIRNGTHEKVSSLGVHGSKDEDIRCLRELITYGLKGLSAYMMEVNSFNAEDERIDAFIQKALSSTLDDTLNVDDLFELAIDTGRYGAVGMSLLDQVRCERYGKPSITTVSRDVGKKPGILVTGHNLRDLEMLLEQSKGCGIDIYTHSEMLSAHYYPRFKEYPHLVGNYGTSWYSQRVVFERFHGPILVTSGCVMPPAGYEGRMWTTGAAGAANCEYIPNVHGNKKDFSAIIEQAKKSRPPACAGTGKIIGGFAHDQMEARAEIIADAVKNGLIRMIIAIVGCVSNAKTRQYYTDLARALPKDALVLTAGCIKYRLISQELGDIEGIPQMLDAGQCSDSYSIILTLLHLKSLLDAASVDQLPVMINLSWLEQRSILLLLILFSLGIKNIYLGPSLPAFISPNIQSMIMENYGIKVTSSIESIQDVLQSCR